MRIWWDTRKMVGAHLMVIAVIIIAIVIWPSPFSQPFPCARGPSLCLAELSCLAPCLLTRVCGKPGLSWNKAGDPERCLSLWAAGEVFENHGRCISLEAETRLQVPDLDTYHSPPVHRETPIRLHDNGAEFHVLRVSAVALWSEPAHGSWRGGGWGQNPNAG